MILTTITPYWGRPDMLRLWVDNLKMNSHVEVQHLVYFVGESLPIWWDSVAAPNVVAILSVAHKLHNHCIGYYHNLGALAADTEWIMKLDLDAFPNPKYFESLLPLLLDARPREWFNGGMFYLSKEHSPGMLKHGLSRSTYQIVMENRRFYSASPYLLPAATNFVCRRKDYLELGGCSDLFKDYGWEDYQQIYMLEKHWLGSDPLPGPLNLENVTLRCRELSRRKAKELWLRSPWLCLLHHWHPSDKGIHMRWNRKVLYDYVQERRHT